MSQDKLLYTETFKIRSSEVRPDGKAKLQTLCDLLQEAAGNHALQLNFDVSQLREENLTWILHRLDVEINRYPEWREEVTVQTWPSRGDTLRAYRDFRILDHDQNELGKALSYWLMVDIETHRPVRMPQEVLDMGQTDREHVLPLKKDRLSIPGETTQEKTFSVRKSDLDVNQHVNNVRYVEWALEALPEDPLIGRMDIEFRAECEYGDVILSKYRPAESPEAYAGHLIMRKADQQVLAVAQSLPAS